MYAYIARQPIFDRGKKVAAYELLYRSGTGGNTARIFDADAATRSVLNGTFGVFGISRLTDNLPAHINFTRNLLMEDFAYLADPKEIVIEVPGDIQVDDQLVQKLSELNRRHYRLSLTNYNEQMGRFRFDKIIHLFDFVRIDVSRNSRLQTKALIRRLSDGHAHARLLATRVETLEDFTDAKNMDFSLFQGYFFEKPTFLSKRLPSLAGTSYGRLFNELLRPAPNYDRCVEIIESDPVLTHMFQVRVRDLDQRRNAPVPSTRQGLMMVGTEELRRWISMVLLRQNNVTQSDETVRRAYLRGVFIERLMERSETALDPRQGFLMGVFSLLDKVMGTSLNSLLTDLNLESAMKAALLGREENEYSLFLQFAVIYEMANPRLLFPDIRLRILPEQISPLYMECMAETDRAFAGPGGVTE